MAEGKSFVFNFVASGIDKMVTGIGQMTDKTKEAAKQVSNMRQSFAKMYETHRNEGKGVFSSFNLSIKQMVTQAGGLAKILMTISRIGAGGILLFLGSKAMQNNLGGIATAFGKLSAAFGEFWGKFNIMINEIMRAMSPLVKVFVDLTSTILLDFLKILTRIVEAITKAPKAIQILIGILTTLGLVMWGLSTNPFFITVAAAVVAIWGLYKGIKAIVDLIRGNSNMTIRANATVAGRDFNLIGDTPTTSVNNSVNNINNNVYLQGTGSGAGDAAIIADRLSLSNTIAKTYG